MMASEIVHLDLHTLTADQQVEELKRQFLRLRGRGAVVRALAGALPVRQYISMLERGYRVTLEREDENFVLVLRPDGSMPRLGVRGAHSIASDANGRIYSNTTNNRVAVIDAASRKLLKHFSVGDDPSHLQLSHDGRRLYVANTGSNDVTIINTMIDERIANAPCGQRPLLPCVAGNGDVYLPSGPDKSVTVLDAEGRRRATIPVGLAPHDIAISPGSRWAYQPNSASHTVTIIDAHDNSLAGEIQAGLGPSHIAFDHESRFAYVANTVSDDVAVISTNNHEVIARIPAGKGAHLPVLSPDDRYGYVANFASDDLTVWDCRTLRVVAAIPVGIYPHFFAPSPDGKWLVVSNTGESSVCIIDAHEHKIRACIKVGGAPAHLAFSPDNELAFVGCEKADEIAVIELGRQRLVQTVQAGGQPS